MPTFTPEQISTILQFMMPALKNEHGITRRVIGAIPPDKADYRPDGVSKSAIALAQHTVSVEIMFLKAVVNGSFDFSASKAADNFGRPADLVSWYDAEFENVYEALGKAAPEQLAQIMDFRGMFQLPAAVYLQFATHHTIHHRGQISMYLRPMGAKVPAMYGDSADEKGRQA